MWELIKNNPIIKIAAVLIVGIIGFGILSNVLFGYGYGGHGGGGRNGGFGSTTGVLMYLYMVFFKLLIFALVISLIALAVRAVYKFMNGSGESLLKSPLSDPYVKTATALGISVLALIVFTPIISGILGIGQYQGFGGYGARMMSGYGYMHDQYGNRGFNGSYGYGGFNLNELLILILKVFMILSIIGVLVGLAMFLYKNYPGLISAKPAGNTCAGCGVKVDKSATFCSNCGQRQPSAVELVEPAVEAASTEPSKGKKGAEKTKSVTPDNKTKVETDDKNGTQTIM